MGAFGGFVLTNKGRNLQAKAQTGVTLNYTRMGVGDGQLGGQSIPVLTKLIGEKKSLAISKLKIQTQGRAVIGAVLSNQDVATGFYFREIGIYAQDPDEGEILYCYGNAGANAEYIPPVGGADIIEKSIDAIVVVGNAANVTATIDSSLVYATQGDLQDAENRSKKYTDEQITAIDVNITGEEILTELKKVDGTGSGLDADLLQGKSPSAFLEKATGGTINGPVVVDTTNQTGKQVSVNAWGDLSASSGGQTVWGNNCYVDQGGKHRFSNTHQNLGATGIRLNYGNIEYFDTGRIATTAGTEFTPVWRKLVTAGGYGADLLDGFHASDFVKAVGMGSSGNTVPGGDWNNALTTGFYMHTLALNSPPIIVGSSDWFFGLAIEHNTDWVVQTLTDFNNVAQWTRSRSNGVWGPWKRIIRDDMIRINNGKLEYNDGTTWKAVGGGMEQYKPIVKRQTVILTNPQTINAIDIRGKSYLSKIIVGTDTNSVRLRVFIDGSLYFDTLINSSGLGAILQSSDISYANDSSVMTYGPDLQPRSRLIGGSGSGYWWARPNDFPSSTALGAANHVVLPQPIFAKASIVIEVSCSSGSGTTAMIDFAGGVPV
ncbi:phage tail-collar fiber domain-containing protein [Paenibacillus chitinolyticus]|uniref:phage tail-collar fiber domain-containing protein n=1 Tax=Paenibacillus chitinolyticus TaxID=79263 RepID=UPI00363ED757